MTREELRALWDKKEAARQIYDACLIRDVGRLSADERFEHDIATQKALGESYRARTAFDDAVQYGKVAA